MVPRGTPEGSRQSRRTHGPRYSGLRGMSRPGTDDQWRPPRMTTFGPEGALAPSVPRAGEFQSMDYGRHV